jgi:hypothetical protein
MEACGFRLVDVRHLDIYVYGFVLVTKYYTFDKTKENEMGVLCNTYGGEVRCIPGFDGEPEGKRTLERPMDR